MDHPVKCGKLIFYPFECDISVPPLKHDKVLPTFFRAYHARAELMQPAKYLPGVVQQLKNNLLLPLLWKSRTDPVASLLANS